MPQVPDVPLGGLYGDLIMDHYRSPRNRRPVSPADIEAEEFNPFCGDRVALQLRLDAGGRVCASSAQSEGCSIIQATASMMSEAVLGMDLGELEGLSEMFRGLMEGNGPALEGPCAGPGAPAPPEAFAALTALTVVRRFPVRIKCALLPWVALEEGGRGLPVPAAAVTVRARQQRRGAPVSGGYAARATPAIHGAGAWGLCIGVQEARRLGTVSGP